MSMTPIKPFAVLSSLVVTLAGCARTAQTTQASLPIPLASALLNDRFNGTRPSPTFTVGAVPSGYPASLVPTAPARVVGAMTTADEIVVVFDDSTRRLAAVMEQVFDQAGFHRPPPTPGYGFSPGTNAYSYFCKDGATVSAAPLTGSQRTFARVSYRPTHGPPTCPDPGARSREVIDTYLQIPEMKPAPGVHVSGSGGGAGVYSGSEGVEEHASLYGTNLVTSAILSHYAAQLTAAGWTGAAPAISERLSAQFFEARDAKGTAWEGVLMALGGGPTMEVSLNMHRQAKP